MTNAQLEEAVTNLNSVWMNTISGLHHKDRDCHWSIRRRWSYGSNPVWIVEHFGYLEDEVEQEVKTYQEALELVIKKLEQAIKHWENVSDV